MNWQTRTLTIVIEIPALTRWIDSQDAAAQRKIDELTRQVQTLTAGLQTSTTGLQQAVDKES